MSSLDTPNDAPSVPTVKIYGERNTGTNYLEALIDLNLETNLLPGSVPKSPRLRRTILRSEFAKDLYFQLTYPRNLGWKHAVPPTTDTLHTYASTGRALVVLTLTKNPYSWLLSMYKRPYHADTRHTTFEEFVTSLWHTVVREHASAAYENPIVMWNAKNAAYLKLQETERVRCINLRYEDLLADPGALIEQIASTCEILRRQPTFVNQQRSTKETNKDFSYYSDYYLHERWKEELDSGVISTINSYLDKWVMEQFGYEQLDVPR